MAADNRKIVTFFFHLSIFAMYLYTLIYETFYIPEAPHRKTYAGRFKFLTFWNQVRATGCACRPRHVFMVRNNRYVVADSSII